MSLTTSRFDFNWPDCQPIAKAKFASRWLVEFRHVPEVLDIHALALYTSATLSALAQEMYRDEGAGFVCRFQRIANRISIDIETVEPIIELHHYIPLVCLFKSLNVLVGPIETIQGQKLEDWQSSAVSVTGQVQRAPDLHTAHLEEIFRADRFLAHNGGWHLSGGLADGLVRA